MRPSGKQVIAISQASTTNAATATGNIDTLGYDLCEIDVIASTAAVTNALTTLKISHSDDTVVTNFADVSGFVGGTDFTIPAPVTEGTWGCKLRVDMRGRKRYLKVSISPVATQLFTAIGNLTRADEAPNSATDANVKALVEG